MSPDLRARVLAEIARVPSPTRSEVLRRSTFVSVAGAIAIVALFFAMGGPSFGEKPLELVALTAGAAAVVTAVARRLAIPRPGSMLGRPAHLLVLACVFAAAVLALSLVVAAFLFPELAKERVPASTDLACGAMTIVQGTLPLLLLVAPRRGADPVHPAITGALLGATAGSFAAALAYVRCPHGETLHCALAHVLPMLLLAAVGAAVGRTLLRPK